MNVNKEFDKELGCNVPFYFTFGSHEDFPYKGGWVEVWAICLNEAVRKFKRKYPNIYDNILNCADYYNKKQFDNSGMMSTSNRGAFCHEVIE